MAAKKKAFFAKNCEKMARFQKFFVKKVSLYVVLREKLRFSLSFHVKKASKKKFAFFRRVFPNVSSLITVLIILSAVNSG